jgi:hypothetical protein
MTQVNKSHLTNQKQRLIELMQDINFGRIINLVVHNGEPEFTPETVIQREIRLGGQNGPRPERERDDFALKQEVVALFEQFIRMETGTIRELSIKHGLPFLMRIEQRAA